GDAGPAQTGGGDGSSAVPTVFKTGKLGFSAEVDLDSGQGSDRNAADISGADLVFQYDAEGKWSLNPVNHALISSPQEREKIGVAEQYARCVKSAFSAQPVNFTIANTGNLFCVRTNEGRVAVLAILNIQVQANPLVVQTIHIDYLTWNKVEPGNPHSRTKN
ncbi:MAG: hypothetical protein M3Y41_10010, partial [Pseudomonadota bacterium]|nr:hypothetical protein [Pseudomonadota bacterium]